MNKKYSISLYIWFLLMITFISHTRLLALNFSFKLSYGISYLSIGDTNEYLKSFGELYAVSKPFDYLHYGSNLSAELLFQLAPRLNVYLGTGLISASLKDNQRDRSIYIYYFKNSAKAIPLILGIRYDLNSGSSKVNIYIKAGAGYHFTTWDMTNVFLYPSFSTKRKQTAKGNSFGANGSIGMEIKFSKTWSFILEATGLYLKVNDLKGEYRYSTSSSDYSNLPIKDTLYYYEYAYYKGGPWMTELTICGKPVGNGVRHVRPAMVDFSGFSLQAGLKINL